MDTQLRWPEGFYCLWDDSLEWDEKLKRAGLDERAVRDLFGYLFGSRLVALLNTAKRLDLLSKGNIGGPDQRPQSLLEVLYNADQETENRLHATFRSVFARDFVLDYSALNNLRLAIGSGPENLPAHPRALREALRDHIPLNDQGDGMRAFLGLLVAVECVDRPVFLVDEPETFLHPPQARRVGELLAEVKAQERRQIFVSTHSVDVLRGLLTSNVDDIQIIRLSRYENHTNVAALNPSELARIANDPVLSSARVLDGLFYSASVVVEGDRDARFYQAVSDRLRTHVAPYFLVSQGKQTVPKLATEYRRLGIPTAAAVDFDILREEALLVDLLEAFDVAADEIRTIKGARVRIEQEIVSSPSIRHRLSKLQEGIVSLREQLELERQDPSAQVLAKARKALGRLQAVADAWRDVKREGREKLGPDGQMAVDTVLAIAARHGLFICPSGELESLMRGDVDASDKSKWLLSALRCVARYQVDEGVNPWQFVLAMVRFLKAELGREQAVPN